MIYFSFSFCIVDHFPPDSDSVQSFKDSQSDATSRPDALYLPSGGYASGAAFVSISPQHADSQSMVKMLITHRSTNSTPLQTSPSYTAQEYEQKITPSSHCSTLRRNDKNLQHAPPIYDSIATKSILQATALSPPTGDLMCNHMNTIVNNQPVQYASLDRKTIDYRHLNQSPAVSYQQNHMDMRQPRNGIINEEYHSDALTNGGIEFSHMNGSSVMAGIMQQHQQQQHMNVMGMTTIPPPVMPRGNATLHSNNTLSKDHNRNLNSRNHIITDTLPGPESCV